MITSVEFFDVDTPVGSVRFTRAELDELYSDLNVFYAGTKRRLTHYELVDEAKFLLETQPNLFDHRITHLKALRERVASMDCETPSLKEAKDAVDAVQ
jgi:hypothetical protein